LASGPSRFPDTRSAFFYLSPDHAEALAGLKIGLETVAA
jgi:hypothetical protein